LRFITDCERLDRNLDSLFLYLLPFPFCERAQPDDGEDRRGNKAKRCDSGAGEIFKQDIVCGQKITKCAHVFFPNILFQPGELSIVYFLILFSDLAHITCV
jgi:hypothetical protein